MQRDGSNESLWQLSPEYAPLNKTAKGKFYDAIIVGGGITGITTALLLQLAGKNCLLLEANTIGFGTTGGTTAHLNNFFDTPYSDVIKNFGKENAQLLAKAAADAMALIKKNIGLYNIDCAYSDTEGYLFSLNEEQDKVLEDIVASAKSVSVDVDFTNSSPFPVPYSKLAAFTKQAQFNPIEYIFGLAKVFEEQGGFIQQHSRVLAIEKDGSVLQVKTQTEIFNAAKVIYATHIPPGVNILHFRCAPYRSYAMAVKLNSAYPAALGYDLNDPYHYYRTQQVNGQDYFIVGGEDHKTGHEENTDQCFRRLESYVRSYFDVASIAFKWSSQYYEPTDGLPYIGHLPGADENIFVATGFGGNGMIYGTLSAMIIADLITSGENIYKDLFNPGRIKPIAGFSKFVQEGADVVAKFIKGRFNAEKIKELSELAAGEAKTIKHDGHILALYKDADHNLHVLNATCTHVKCTVGWNASEKSWDCPCHGARYSISGEVLTGPSQIDLEKIEWGKE